MKSSKLMCCSIAVLTVPTITAAMNAQDVQVRSEKHHHYQLAQIPTLDGPGVNFFDNTNNIAVLNARGVVSGGAADTLIPDPFNPMDWWSNGDVTKGYLLQYGVLTESENGQIDPFTPGLPEISPVMWRDGKITNLETLPGGGYQVAAVSVNNHGELAGIASNLVPDANSLLNYNPNLWAGVGYGYQLRAVFWDQKNGMQDLGRLSTGTNAEATVINERGQIMGDSYTSSARAFAMA